MDKEKLIEQLQRHEGLMSNYESNRHNRKV